MPDFLDETRSEIEARLRELKPLVDEYRRLEAAASALAETFGSAVASVVPVRRGRRGPGRPPSATRKAAAATAAPAKKRGGPAGRKKVGRPAVRKAARPRGSTTKATAATAATAPASVATGRSRPGRRKGSGKRSAQALRLVKSQPGITIPELATKMGIAQNYLYRVLPALEREGKISKQGRGWHPAA